MPGRAIPIIVFLMFGTSPAPGWGPDAVDDGAFGIGPAPGGGIAGAMPIIVPRRGLGGGVSPRGVAGGSAGTGGAMPIIVPLSCGGASGTVTSSGWRDVAADGASGVVTFSPWLDAGAGVDGGGGGVEGVSPSTVAFSAAGPVKRGVAGGPGVEGGNGGRSCVCPSPGGAAG